MHKIEDSDFKRLIGKWNTEGRILTNGSSPESKIIGTDSYEFILGGYFILHRANVLMGDARSETAEIISLESSKDKIKMQYYNSNGERGLMFGFLNGNEFRIESEALRFLGNISTDNTLITGVWQERSDNLTWSDAFKMRLSK